MLPVALRFEMNGRRQAAALCDLDGHRHQVDVDGHRHEVEVLDLSGHRVRFVCDGVMESMAYLRDGARLHFSLGGVPHEVLDTTRAASARHEGQSASDGKLRASMNGRVVAVLVEPGQRVEAGQPVVTLEAMKMEHMHAAPLAGIVKTLHVRTGDQVGAHRVVAEIEASPETPA